MKKSVFEKRHGKITFTKGANWNKSVAEKHNISLDSDADLPAHIWHIMQNMHKAVVYTVVFEYIQRAVTVLTRANRNFGAFRLHPPYKRNSLIVYNDFIYCRTADLPIRLRHLYGKIHFSEYVWKRIAGML